MWLECATDRPDLCAHVIGNMRDADRAEAFATRTDDDEGRLLTDILSCGPVSWVAGIDEPIAVFGCAPMWRGVWSMWFLATDANRRIGFPVTKLITRSIVPMLLDGGAHRLEARSMEGHDDAHAWLEVVGARREGTLKGYGRDGQDFYVYTWERR